MKFVILLLLLFTAVYVTAGPPCLVCQKSLNDTAAAILSDSLNKLAKREGPTYKLLKIHSASTEVVRGLLYKINADLSDQNNNMKTCDIEIFDFKDVTVTIKCPGEDVVKKKFT
ncbi:sarcocystatin-A-like [Musca vetustissima]|uniref:sarcocystatin-A-like n=1 Tax=Musca vetustissima TaxID=27455 RepID=UPI002AB5FC79|nr:sarcocystatin-A-like [Musca vetustissima]